MITVTVVGNNPDRERIAGLILTAMLGGRYTVQRFREGTAPPDSMPGMGVEFVALGERERRAIEAFVRHREPVFFDPD